MIFCAFYANFGLHDSLENAVSEHLEWLKFQKFSEDSTPESRQGETYSARRPLSCIAHCLRKCKKRYP